MNTLKLITAAVLALMGLVIVLQNTESIETKLLFITLEMPRAVLLFGTTTIGFLIGILVSLHFTKGKKRIK